MRTVVQWVSRGDVFRQFVSGFLRVIGVLIAVGGVVGTLVFVISLFRYAEGAGVIIATLCVSILMLVAIYMVTDLFLIRAKTVQDLPTSAYVAIPIAAVVVRLSGELMAVWTTLAGASAFLFGLLAGTSAPMIPGVSSLGSLSSLGASAIGASGFLGGLMALFFSIISAFVILLTTYGVAEMIGVLVDIADNTAHMKTSLER